MAKICTLSIVSKSYEHVYKVCLESLQQHFPPTVEHIKVDPAAYEFLRPLYKHSSELSFICAIRPYIVLEYLKQYDEVIFLGSDVVFYSCPNELFEKHKAIAIPHIISPIPFVGSFPNMESIPVTGHLNTDIVKWTSHPDIIKFLEWQDNTHKNYCIQTNGIFLDQTWLNCLPFFVDGVKILRHPGYNLAYFNLKERNVTKNKRGNKYLVNEKPLICAQFSGFDSGKPEVLSRYTTYKTDCLNIKQLFEDYNTKLIAYKFMEENKLLMQDLAK